MMRLSSKSLATLIASVALLAGFAGAQPEPWLHPNGSIHYYHAISTPSGLNWNLAWDSALGHGGYLATITSQAENDFVFSLVDSSPYWYQRPGTGKLAGPWLGGTQDFGSHEPDSGWHWVTDETMDFVNWSPGQPDNQGNENALHFGESAGVRVPTWNDASCLDDSIRGFVRELSADTTTVGLMQRNSLSFGGYTLFAPLLSVYTYLIDNAGRFVNRWQSSYLPQNPSFLLEDGSLLRPANVNNPYFPVAGAGGRVEIYDWDGNLTWGFNYSDSLHCLHHDVRMLPNGHVVMIAYELKTGEEAIEYGRDPAKITNNKLWVDHLIEVDPATDSIVWEWHIWDHVIQDFDSTKMNYGVVADHSELVDLNLGTGKGPQGFMDWNHINAVDYNPELDQLLISVMGFQELFVIDHSTTTEEAKGHTGGRYGQGGDILYRWGNPQNYGAGDSTNRRFYGIHDTRWVAAGLPGAGHITVFNNGFRRPGGNFSSIDEFVPACDSIGHYPRPAPGTSFGPESLYWQYGSPSLTDFFSRHISGAHRLPNGNTLICEGDDARFWEVTPDSQVVWLYRNPVTDTTPINQGDTFPAPGPIGRLNMTFRATRYAPDYPGLIGHDLTSGYPLELYSTKQMWAVAEPRTSELAASRPSAWPNPFVRQSRISFGTRYPGSTAADVFGVDGRLIRTLTLTGGSAAWDGADNAGRQVSRGIYCCRLRGIDSGRALKLVKVH